MQPWDRGPLAVARDRACVHPGVDCVRAMRFCLAPLVALALVPWIVASPAKGAPGPAPACAGTHGQLRSEQIDVGGRLRSYLVVAPAGTLPLVLAFHGRGETPELLARYSGLSRLDAIVVYPRGLTGKGRKLSWSGTPTAAPDADDVGFAREIVARYEAAHCVDGGRVYATGKSDGGGFAGLLACEAADVVTAVAPVAGAFYPVAGGCRPAHPVAVLEFHGTADRVVPYSGSIRRGLPAIASWLAAWASRDGCTQLAASHPVAAGVSLQAWSPCRGGTTIVGYRVDGGGHTWPGASISSGPGATTHAIDATAIIAKFFRVAGG